MINKKEKPFDHYLVHKLSINVPVVLMARYVMVLRRARSITRGIGRVGPGNRDFFGP